MDKTFDMSRLHHGCGESLSAQILRHQPVGLLTRPAQATGADQPAGFREATACPAKTERCG